MSLKMNCRSCKKDLGERKGFICAMRGGDEYIYSYFYCEDCRKYTIECYHDKFITGDSDITTYQVDKERGNKELNEIKKCPDPSNKHCRCEAHKYFE